MQLFDTCCREAQGNHAQLFSAAIKIILGFLVAILLARSLARSLSLSLSLALSLSLSLSAPAQWSYPRVGGK